MRIGQVKQLIELLESYYPSIEDDLIFAEHDQIWLSLNSIEVDGIPESLKEKIEELNCFWIDEDEESVTGFC